MKQSFLSLLLTLVPMVACADIVEIDGICYNLIPKAKVAEVTNNPKGYVGTIIIPELITYEENTYNVTSISDGAFKGCDGLSTVTIPKGIKSIGNDTFRDCRNLTSITISNSVTSIGNSAFYRCSNLNTIILPEDLLSIGIFAFGYCTALSSLTINYKLNIIGESAFKGCTGLSSVKILSLKSWCEIDFFDEFSNPLFYAHHLYLNDKEIEHLVIPESVNRINNFVFCGCSNIKSVSIPNSVKSFGGHSFYECIGLTSVFIPDDVETIAFKAFEGCKSLRCISIGKGIKNIYGNAFAGCPELTDVYCYANQAPATVSDAFYNSYIDYATLHVPESSIYDYKTTYPWNQFKSIIALTFEETGINSLAIQKAGKEVRFTIDGQRTTKKRKGMTIVKKGDKVVKVMMK